MVPSGLDQPGCDITYIRCRKSRLSRHVLDAFSRRVVGWSLETHLEARLAIAALSMALETRGHAGSLIHHSDRGIHTPAATIPNCFSGTVCRQHEPVGNPYDNARAESFMKTLKQEEVNGKPTVMRSRQEMLSAPSSRKCTIANGCTRRWPTGLPPSSKQIYRAAGLLRSSPAAAPSSLNLSSRPKRWHNCP